MGSVIYKHPGGVGAFDGTHGIVIHLGGVNNIAADHIEQWCHWDCSGKGYIEQRNSM